MKIWVYSNGKQNGPYTLDEFANLLIDGSTPVWYEGLPQWTRADIAPATAHFFISDTASNGMPSQHSSASYSATGSFVNAGDTQPTCPPSYLFWSIFVTICCCMLGGILAIVFSAMTRGRYQRGDYAGAARMSEMTQWTIMISIVLGLMSIPFTALL